MLYRHLKEMVWDKSHQCSTCHTHRDRRDLGALSPNNVLLLSGVHRVVAEKGAKLPGFLAPSWLRGPCDYFQPTSLRQPCWCKHSGALFTWAQWLPCLRWWLFYWPESCWVAMVSRTLSGPKIHMEHKQELNLCCLSQGLAKCSSWAKSGL